MTIHAATVKSAAAKGITVTEDTDLFYAELPDGRKFAQAKNEQEAPGFVKAVIAVLAYEAAGFEGILENESVRIEQDTSGDFVASLVVMKAVAGQLARDPVLSDLLDTLDDEEETLAQVDGIREDLNAEEDEGERTGSVVPDVFKKRYAEAGHPGTCGDWLAVQLNSLCQTMDGKKVVTDLDRLEGIANANDVAPARVDRLGTATNGWQGRYRMTVRNMLAKKVADKGFLLVPEGCGAKTDEERKAPKEWCEKFRTVVKAKKTAPVVAKDEGAGKPSAKTAAKKALAAPAETPQAAPEGKKPYTNGRRSTKADKAAVTK